MPRTALLDTRLGALVRVLAATLLGGFLFLGVGLFSAIVYLMVRSASSNAPVDMSTAYQHVAFPAALAGAACGLAAGLLFERRTRALRG